MSNTGQKAPDYSEYKNLRVSIDDGVAVLTLNRPSALNAVTHEMHGELQRLLPQLDRDDRVRAIIVTGEGSAFSAGGDFGFMKDLHFNVSLRFEAFRGAWELVDVMLTMRKPMVAAVNGAATGLGLTIALLCDVVYAVESARLGDPHVKAGLVPGDGGCLIWPLLVGINRAKEYLLTGDLVDARTAERLGLVNKVVPDGEVMQAAMDLARRLANGPTQTIMWTKMALNQWLRQAQLTSFALSVALEQMSFATSDQLEAVNAFMEKRKPRFTGS
jgi:enoyl-CoA hydratase